MASKMCVARSLLLCYLTTTTASSSPNPIIRYCTSNSKTFSAPDCHLQEISNSTFQFGKLDEKVIHLNIETVPKFILLKCEAPYPIRWLAKKPVGSIHVLSNDESNRLGHDPFKGSPSYSQGLYMEPRVEFSHNLRCERYSNTNEAAEVFIDIKNYGRYVPNLWTYTYAPLLFVLNDTEQSSQSFLIPQVADEYNGNYHIPITKDYTSDNKKVGGLTGECTACICRASSSDSLCGEIPSWYNVAGKSPRMAFEACRRDEICAQELIQQYLQELDVNDCNDDGLRSCEDYARVYFGKDPTNQCPLLNDTINLTLTTLHSCLVEKKLNFTVLEYQKEDYDPRIGLIVREQVDFQFQYEMFVPINLVARGSTVKIPVRAHNRVRATFSSSDNQVNTIRCDITTEGNFPQPKILVGKCTSLADCELKFEAYSNTEVFNTATSHLTKDFHEKEGDGSITPASISTGYSHGFVLCHATYMNKLTGQRFLSHGSYFFTGVNNLKYLISDIFPRDSIIRMKNNNEQPMRASTTYTFECEISTFILLPNIQFVIRYKNGEQHVVPVTNRRNRINAHYDSVNVDKATLKWRLELAVHQNMTQVSCYAPRINSSAWANVEVNIFVEALEPPPGPEANNHQVETYATAFGSIAGALFILLSFAVFLLLRRNRKIVVGPNLNPEEVGEYLHGSSNQNPRVGDIPCLEVVPFPQESIISTRELVIENSVLGKGQFGVVHQGVFKNEKVAVKSCKPSTNVEHFRAFLKEVKVMAFIGDHPNIVRFLGAVVNGIDKGMCKAVIELSPFGNLNGFLRKYSAKYSDNAQDEPSYGYKRFDMELEVMLNKSVLTSFCAQIARGMEYLTQKKVLHGDLATRNVLVFPGNVVKITDFGLSRKLYDSYNYMKKSKSPLPWPWMALESLRFNEFSSQSDVWSFGVTVWEIFSMGQVPFAGLICTNDFAEQVEAGLRLSKPRLASSDIYQQMMACWQNDPQNRPTFSQCKIFFEENQGYLMLG